MGDEDLPNTVSKEKHWHRRVPSVNPPATSPGGVAEMAGEQAPGVDGAPAASGNLLARHIKSQTRSSDRAGSWFCFVFSEDGQSFG